MKGFLLWALALVLMLTAAVYQRRTGPTYPVYGELTTPAGKHWYELPRSHVTTSGARISVPAVTAAGTLFWRRFPLDEPFRPVPLTRSGDTLWAELPPQPPAGKVEYYLELPGASTPRLPVGRTVVLRYHGEVPWTALAPHIFFMFISMLIAVRAGLGALFARPERTLAWTALAGFTIGGMILGPVVQKYAFGAFWTGVPFGWDLTDNKTLLMWLCWLLACLLPPLLGRSGRDQVERRWRRTLILTAAVATVVVYVIPHSAQGSQLDYETQEVTQ